jgi:hypothetical protein
MTMTRTLSRIALVAFAGWLMLGPGTSPAHAQRRPMTVGQQSARNLARAYAPYPNWPIAPGLTLNQYAYNLRVLGRAYSQVPPYALGYNPYPSVINYGPVYGSSPYASYYPYYYPYNLYTPSLYGSYLYNPYALSGFGLATSPYLP